MTEHTFEMMNKKRRGLFSSVSKGSGVSNFFRQKKRSGRTEFLSQDDLARYEDPPEGGEGRLSPPSPLDGDVGRTVPPSGSGGQGTPQGFLTLVDVGRRSPPPVVPTQAGSHNLSPLSRNSLLRSRNLGLDLTTSTPEESMAVADSPLGERRNLRERTPEQYQEHFRKHDEKFTEGQISILLAQFENDRLNQKQKAEKCFQVIGNKGHNGSELTLKCVQRWFKRERDYRESSTKDLFGINFIRQMDDDDILWTPLDKGQDVMQWEQLEKSTMDTAAPQSCTQMVRQFRGTMFLHRQSMVVKAVAQPQLLQLMCHPFYSSTRITEGFFVTWPMFTSAKESFQTFLAMMEILHKTRIDSSITLTRTMLWYLKITTFICKWALSSCDSRGVLNLDFLKQAKEEIDMIVDYLTREASRKFPTPENSSLNRRATTNDTASLMQKNTANAASDLLDLHRTMSHELKPCAAHLQLLAGGECDDAKCRSIINELEMVTRSWRQLCGSALLERENDCTANNAVEVLAETSSGCASPDSIAPPSPYSGRRSVSPLGFEHSRKRSAKNLRHSGHIRRQNQRTLSKEDQVRLLKSSDSLKAKKRTTRRKKMMRQKSGEALVRERPKQEEEDTVILRGRKERSLSDSSSKEASHVSPSPRHNTKSGDSLPGLPFAQLSPNRHSPLSPSGGSHADSPRSANSGESGGSSAVASYRGACGFMEFAGGDEINALFQQPASPKKDFDALTERTEQLLWSIIQEEKICRDPIRDYIFNPFLEVRPALLDYGPEILAQQLSLLQGFLFSQVRAQEYMLWTISKEKSQDCPNLLLLIDHFNWIASLVSTEICMRLRQKERLAQYGFFIQVAKFLLEYRNFLGATAVVGGLCQRPVCRMEGTFRLLGEDIQRSFEDVKRCVPLDTEVTEYRKLLQEKSRFSSVPYTGLITKDITFLKDGNQTYLESSDRQPKLLNWANKFGKIAECALRTKALSWFQFPSNPNEALLKILFFGLPVMTSDQAFEWSRTVEPKDHEALISEMLQRQLHLESTIKQQEETIRDLEKQLEERTDKNDNML
eukprot:CAMPEP_0119129942 /NCGR_PEP_ID=MMETSP1310-20130426/7483_1 /TAXON_ID=464262 /ORGANISM="Genus nov. species nov., Strain RCC2339" /LENGTH=1055 /DNA_ID=CAMNT_0007120405 /DNA_START=89 /DNA_END=3259 /DNA_ORIENTATION=+